MRIFGLNITREKRSETGTLANPPAWLREALGAVPTASGISVTEENALTIGAVFAAIRVLSEGVASLPLKVYRRSGRARDVAPGHALYSILHDQANDLTSAYDYRELAMVDLCTWGNHYAEKQFDGRGRIVGLWRINPAMVTVKVDTAGTQPAIEYTIRTGKGTVTLGRDRIFHIRALGTDPYVGKSPIRLARETLGIGQAAEKYGAKFFSNDARPGVVITTPQVLSDTAYEHLRTSWAAAYGGASNAWKPAILEQGTDIKTLSLPPEDAQFIETRKFQVTEVARIFRVQPHLIGDLEKATFSNIEHQAIEHVVHTLRPWLVRWEKAITMQLLEPSERREFYAEHLVDGLLRGDIKSRYEAYAIARNWGWLSANDVRERENENPVEAGDTYLQPLNMVAAGTQLDARSTTEGRAREAGPTPVEAPIEHRAAPPRVAVSKSLEPVLVDVFRKIVKREVSELRKGIKKYLEGGDRAGFRAWLEAFAREHAAWMEPRLLPVFESMAEAMCAAAADEISTEVTPDELGDFVQQYTAGTASWYAGSSRGQLEALLEEDDAAAAVDQRLTEWEDRKAGKYARRERQRSSNAMTKAAWALAGITAIVWRTAGETCDLCDALNGKRTSMSVPFVEADGDVGGLVVRTSIGHPPLHDGCDCYLSPGTGSRKRFSDTELRSVFESILSEPHHEDHDHGHED